MNTHNSTFEDGNKNEFETLLTETEKRVSKLRETYREKGAECIETRLAIGEALVPLNILYEDAYDSLL